jgi:hypothetical protein
MGTGVNHNWTAGEDALLGTMIDREVARRIGLTPLSISNRRKKLGIPPARPTRPARPGKIMGKKPIGKMTAKDYVKAANRARAKVGGRKRKPRKPQPARPLPVALPDLIDGKRIRDLSPEQYVEAVQHLEAVRLINRLQRYGAQFTPRSKTLTEAAACNRRNPGEGFRVHTRTDVNGRIDYGHLGKLRQRCNWSIQERLSEGSR